MRSKQRWVAVAAPATPAVLLEQPLESFALGTPLRVVGFGLNAPGGSAGTKRSGTSALATIAASTFTVVPDPSQPCSLDSGGPAFVATSVGEQLAGVVSHGGASCSAGATLSRVDVYRDAFIRPYVDAVASIPEQASACGPPVPPAAGGCGAASAGAAGWSTLLVFAVGSIAGMRRRRGPSPRP